MTLKRIVVCSRCNQQILPNGRIEKLPLPEFRTDHGPACICLGCVVTRGERRLAEDRARQWGAR